MTEPQTSRPIPTSWTRPDPALEQALPIDPLDATRPRSRLSSTPTRPTRSSRPGRWSWRRGRGAGLTVCSLTVRWQSAQTPLSRPGSVSAVETHPVALGQLAINPFNAAELIATFGVIGVLAIIFAETGLLVGFFFPGDSLLFLAGIAASPFADEIFHGVQLNIWALLIGAPICAIAGAQLGHLLGARLGRGSCSQAELQDLQAGVRGQGRALLQQVRPGQGGDPGPLHPDRADVPEPGRRRAGDAGPRSSSSTTSSAACCGPTASC